MQQPNQMNSVKKYKLKVVQSASPVCNDIKHANSINPNTKTKKKEGRHVIPGKIKIMGHI